MDLPTCPSCGQSVLDDDAADCPFCGSAMDGSSKGKKKPAAPAAKPASKSASGAKTAGATKPVGAAKPTTDEDDPFGLVENAATRKVIPCARKPMKGRTHRVRCPMCDSLGFVPKSAIGRQVKCANPKCMVPTFTVPDPDAAAGERAPARVSDEALAREEKLSKPKGKSNPLIMYGVAGGILLALTVGLVMFLNAPPAVDPNLNETFDMSKLQSGGDDEDDAQDPVPSGGNNPSNGEKTTDVAAEALRLTELMVSAARQTTNNRDKPFCRRLTGDAYLRLGKLSEAATEFSQLQRLSRDATYYVVEPYLHQYWLAIASGDAAAAAPHLADAKQEAQRIPDTGRLALQAGIALAAALVNEGDVDTAMARIENQQRDQTVTAQLDDMRQGAWFASAGALRRAGFNAISPVTVFSWNEPLKTAVAVHLAANKRWPQAVTWAKAQSDVRTAADVLAVASSHAVVVSADAATATLLHEAAAEIDPAVGLRTAAILGHSDQNQALWDAALVETNQMESPAVAQMPDLADVIRTEAPDLSGERLKAAALADVAAAAVARKDDAVAVAAIQKLYALLSSRIPPTTAVRQAASTMESDEQSIMKQLQDRFALRSESEVKSQFRNYRRGLDRLATIAEERRLLLVQLLHRVVESGGAAALQTACAGGEQALLRELAVDPLCMLLASAAVSAGQQIPELAQPDASLAVPAAARIDQLAESLLAPAILSAASAMQQANYAAAVDVMQKARELPGFRACIVNHLIAAASNVTADPAPLLTAVQLSDSALWREDGMLVATGNLARRSLWKAAEAWLAQAHQSATERAVALFGIVAVLAEMPAEPPTSAKPAAEQL
ncbi:MAG: hypothetical protein R3C19_08790 [Planctomycetaceae bacterium]